jgi:predicted enzyme related to lactoylglutathione lyase
MTGKIVHFELPAVDSDRAQQFWGSLWGWQFADSGMPEIDYRMARVDETLGAAIAKADKPQGYPNVYFDTDDMDGTLTKVRELGGSTEDKSPVPGMGWFSLCKDTEGNAFGLWQSDSSAGQ